MQETKIIGKRPPYMVCSVCGREIKPHEEYDFSQSRRKTVVYWHRNCYQKKRGEEDGK